MSALTAVVIGFFVAYVGLALTGHVTANFSLVLFVCTVVTGAYWLAERFYFVRRVRGASGTAGTGAPAVEPAPSLSGRPWWLEYTAGFFPVIAAVFFLRSFVAEPFRIPSGSMIPTLVVGDLILVNKFAYGIRLPVINTKIVPIGEPQRGDVMVFRYPKDESFDYIKRVVGLPGDEIVYEDKRLTINGQPVATGRIDDYFDPERLRFARQYDEKLGSVDHHVLIDDGRGSEITPETFPFRDQCTYNARGVRCRVPPGHYFMMGDNRDNSLDSRYWGFVPERNIVGKAFFIWMNFGDLSRIGAFR